MSFKIPSGNSWHTISLADITKTSQLKQFPDMKIPPVIPSKNKEEILKYIFYNDLEEQLTIILTHLCVQFISDSI